MKLINKKTGEVGQIGYVATQDGQIIVEDISGEEYPYSVICSYKTLAELNEEWEDYEPKEPLIKDEKIRKVVRAWAEANGFNADYYEFNIKTLPAGTRFSVEHYDIEFIGFFIYDLQTENSYTIAELCREEEE